MTPRRYFVLVAVMVLGALGDCALSRGMKQLGPISLSDWPHLFFALTNPWVLAGIVLLIGFMANYLTALSFADLTYVLPATAIGYIVMAGLAKYFLHEQVNTKRWLGILLITIGVGFVAGGPSQTPAPQPAQDGCKQAAPEVIA